MISLGSNLSFASLHCTIPVEPVIGAERNFVHSSLHGDAQDAKSTDVNGRTTLAIGLRFPQHFVRDRRNIAFAEKHELRQVFQWIPLGPAKVDMRTLVGPITDCEQDGGYGVRNRRAFGPKNPKLIDLLTTNSQ